MGYLTLFLLSFGSCVVAIALSVDAFLIGNDLRSIETKETNDEGRLIYKSGTMEYMKGGFLAAAALGFILFTAAIIFMWFNRSRY